MKFLLVLCFLALAAADEDKVQDKTPIDTTQNASALSQASSPLFNTQVFPPTAFANVSPLAYTGFNGNLSPIQTVNPDFFAAPVPAVGNAAISAFPVTRTVLPGTSAVVNGIQSAFPVTGGAFPAGVSGIPTQFPTIVGGILSAAGGVPGVTGGALDPNTAAAQNAAIASVPAAAYRFLTPETLGAIPTQGLQGLQAAQAVGIPSFTGGVLTPLTNGVFQGQNIPASIFQGQNVPTGVFQGQNIPTGILKNPTGTATGISNVPGLTTGNISGPLTNVFRH